MEKFYLDRLCGALSVCFLGLVACSPESSGSLSTSSTTGGQGGAGGAGASGGASTTTGSGAGGAATTGTGGGTTNGACPTGQFPDDKQIVFDSSSAPIQTDTVWTKDNLYLVKTELEVRALLTIEAGTTVCFDATLAVSDFFGLRIGDNSEGGIVAQGTADEHVTFTALDPEKGWHGIHIEGHATKIDLAYTDFYFGSRADGGSNDYFSVSALRVRDGSDVSAPAARLHHVMFAGAKRGGPLRLEADAGLTADSVVSVGAFDLMQDDLEFNDPAVLIAPEAATSLFPSMISIAPEVPESKRGIELISGSMSGDSTLRALGVPYFVRDYLSIADYNHDYPRKMTIEAGVEVRFGSTAVIQAGGGFVGSQGDLIVDGTADKPVQLVYYPFPGSIFDYWGALVFDRYDPAVSRVSYALLKSAGGNASVDVSDACGESSSMGAIVLRPPGGGASSTDYPSIAIDHTTIDGSYQHGIVADCGFGCIDPAIDYMDPALGNVFLNIAGQPQILATCP